MPELIDPDRRSDRPAAVVLHGAGSVADLVVRAFRAPLAAAGLRLVTYELRRGGVGVEAHLDDLAGAVTRTGARVVGGVSLGAHTAIRYAAAAPAGALDGVLAVLPAWTGHPGSVAALSGTAADELERSGVPATLARLSAEVPGWVVDELTTAWPAYPEADLVAALRATAASDGPDPDALPGLAVPVGLVARLDDPLHPATVAHDWARLLPRAVVRELAADAPAADRAVLGAAAVEAWSAAVSGSR